MTLYLAANFVAFLAMMIDKGQAKRGHARIPEARLLLVAAFGWIGAKVGQGSLRHKTQKQPFGRWLNGLLVVHLIGWVGLSVLVAG